jgi:hypothetical protein
MRTLIYVILLLVSTDVASNADGVYYCHGEDSNGFQWENGRYERSSFHTEKFKIHVDGMQIELRGHPSAEEVHTCEYMFSADLPSLLTCRSNGNTFNFNAQTGHFTYSVTFDWLLAGDGDLHDTMDLEYGVCDKFD